MALVKTASARRFLPTVYVLSRYMKNIRIFYLIFFFFLVVKLSKYLNRCVFVMPSLSVSRRIHLLQETKSLKNLPQPRRVFVCEIDLDILCSLQFKRAAQVLRKAQIIMSFFRRKKCENTPRNTYCHFFLEK